MPAAIFDDEDSPPIDPDDLKLPESPQHRRTSDLIGLVAASLLGDEFEVFRDMNWYPPDEGNAMAPDVLVLPAGAWVPPPDHGKGETLKSYRQDLTGGPAPAVAIEVPSVTDGFVSLLGKLDRCRKLGTIAYVVSTEAPRSVLRWSPSDGEHPDRSEDWLDRPIPELGWLRITFDDDHVVVTMPDGTRATSDVDLLAQTQQRADQAENRAAELERRLRDLGVDPSG